VGQGQTNQREWVLLPDPGYDDVDPELVGQEVLNTIPYAERLGFATTISPLRVKRADGTYFHGGFVLRSFAVPAVTEDQYRRMRGADDAPVPQLDPSDEPEDAPSGTQQD
jgi:hypothetical protein